MLSSSSLPARAPHRRVATALLFGAFVCGCTADPAAPAPADDLATPLDATQPPDTAMPAGPDFTLPRLDFSFVPPDLFEYGDLAATGDFAGQLFPAPHPPAPQIGSGGGRILAAPRLVSVTFVGDKLAASLDAFLEALPGSGWWTATMGEYGIGAGTTAPPVHLAEPAAKKLDDTDVAAWLVGKLDGTHPEFGIPDANSLYMIYYPVGTTITLNGSASCASFGGYHGSTKIKDGTPVAYAVIPRCQIGVGPAAVDALTGPASHEVVEAVTDADPAGRRAYSETDAANRGYTFATGGAELGDLCDFVPGAFYKGALGFVVQRTWSNAAARASHDPCVPAPVNRAYFNAAPVLTDMIHLFGNNTMPGIKAALGQSATIELDLFSDGPTQPWTVDATMEHTVLAGSNQSLAFKFDSTTGVNGTKLHLTVTVLKYGPNNHETFAITSTLGPTTNMWFVVVSDS